MILRRCATNHEFAAPISGMNGTNESHISCLIAMESPFIMPGRNLLSGAILLGIFFLTVHDLVSAKSVKMVTSWFNPKYQGQEFHKVLVIGVAQDLEVRADFEDEMAAQIARPGIETIPGNQILLRPDPKAKPDFAYLRV